MCELKVGFETHEHQARRRLISLAAVAYRKAAADLIVATASFCGAAVAVDPPKETFDERLYDVANSQFRQWA
jgi:hypothetical protein